MDSSSKTSGSIVNLHSVQFLHLDVHSNQRMRDEIVSGTSRVNENERVSGILSVSVERELL